MGKRSRQKRERRREASRRNATARLRNEALPAHAAAVAWADGEGLHTLVPGETPTPEQLEEMSRVYQQKIRQSPLWDQMVAEFGPDEAERLLKTFRVQLR